MREIVETNQMTLAQKKFDLPKLADLINKGYLADGREPSDRAKKSFAPSGIGYGSGTCARQWFYAFTGGVVREESADATGIANMAYGTDAHTRIQKVFKNTGILVEAERKIDTIGSDTFPPILGFADLVIKWQGEEAVGEIKTTTQESYVSKKAKNQPAGYHLLQVLIYMKVMGLNKGFLIYENKNQQNLLVLPVTWNPTNKKFIDDVFAWMTTTYKAWEDGQKPMRPFKSDKSPACKSCAFKTHCWTDKEDGVVDLPVLDVPK
jgi:CRISPR/Cas system-associated exonuclease Cas4 (RecB family)